MDMLSSQRFSEGEGRKCCEMEESWKKMGLEEVDHSLSEIILRAVAEVNRIPRLKTLRELQTITRMMKMQMQAQLLEMSTQMQQTIKRQSEILQQYRVKIEELRQKK